jgi:hypothetical protein
MSVDLFDDATYPMGGVGTISFQMPWGDSLELIDVLFVLGLKKNILLVSCMQNLHCMLSLMLRRSFYKSNSGCGKRGLG